MIRRKHIYKACLGAAFYLSLSMGAHADSSDLTGLSLEALMDLEVTSVSKKEELASRAPAAVYVLTGDDIRRSGATSIPQALRLVPGLNVARIDASRWAISARGFNGVFANKLLVLIDGRSVYTPLFSGVFWDAQDTVLEDVDRIEVIRGPGAALWGANAVNGVINIITKKSSDTKGGLISAGAGTDERAVGAIRYGEHISEHTDGRVYLKYSNYDNTEQLDGDESFDAWDLLRGGGRLDYDDGVDSLFLNLEGYGGNQELGVNISTLQEPFSFLKEERDYLAGGHFLARWGRTLEAGRRFAMQVYYDKVDRENVVLRQRYDTIDLDSQFSMPIGESQEIMFGINYRLVHDDLRPREVVGFDPSSRDLDYISAFVQDEIKLNSDTKLVVGSKFEHNEYTGFEVQPTVRLAWTPSKSSALWAAVSRATRTPSRADNDLSSLTLQTFRDPATGLPTLLALEGSRSLDSESLIATEVGYRWQPHSQVSFDIALFYNHYDDLINAVQQSPEFVAGEVPFVRVPMLDGNVTEADTFGGEAVLDFLPVRNWHVQFGYSYVNIAASSETDAFSATTEETEDRTPENQLLVRSLLKLPHGWELDAHYRFVDTVASFDIPSYHELNLRLGWEVSESLEFSLMGRNLLDQNHPEYFVDIIRAEPAEIGRSFFGKIIWRF